MKTKSIVIFAVILFLITAVNLKAEHFFKEKTTDIDISNNMICSMSMPLMKKALKSVKGVESVDIDVNEKKVTVTFDDSLTDLSKLEDVFSKAGFKANDKDADLMGYESLPKCCKTK